MALYLLDAPCTVRLGTEGEGDSSRILHLTEEGVIQSFSSQICIFFVQVSVPRKMFHVRLNSTQCPAHADPVSRTLQLDG